MDPPALCFIAANPTRWEKGGVSMLMDDDPVRKAPRRLDEMSIEELKERIAALRAEIEAAEGMIARKEASRQAAEAAFFRK
jgi:uncharacterized small protein (DUF1192 family)